MPDGIQRPTQLEHPLFLLAWLNCLPGYRSDKTVLDDTQTALRRSSLWRVKKPSPMKCAPALKRV